MPRKLKVLSGEDVVRILANHGFELRSTRGSHAKLQRIRPDGTRQTLTIPTHRELDKGTLRAIFRQATRYVDEESLRPDFYSE